MQLQNYKNGLVLNEKYSERKKQKITYQLHEIFNECIFVHELYTYLAYPSSFNSNFEAIVDCRMVILESTNIFQVLFHEQKKSLTVISVLHSFIIEQYVQSLLMFPTSHDLQDLAVKLNYVLSSIKRICSDKISKFVAIRHQMQHKINISLNRKYTQ